MNTDPETWRQIAFSHQQIADFLRIAALPSVEADRLFGGRSASMRCFGVGFYFFVIGIRNELPPEFGGPLHDLACRVEQVCLHAPLGSWDQNAEQAAALLQKHFPPSGFA